MTDILPRPVTYALFLAAIGWLLVLWLWADAPIGLTYDDAFYYLEIGRRLADGQGSTFDGLHSTNGYHPLWLALCALAYLPGWPEGTDWTPLRLLLSLQVLFVVFGVGAALRALPWVHADRAANLTAAVVTGCWLLVPALTRTQLNGLESAVVVLTQGAVIGALLRVSGPLHRATSRQRWGLGGLLALALLARTDAALLVPLVGLFALPAALRDGARGVGRLVAVGLPPTVVLAAFLAINQAWFGTAMQVSGTLKRVAPGWSGLAIVATAAVAIGALAFVASRGGPTKLPRVTLVVRRAGPHLAFVLALTGYYLGLQTFARAWYFAPATLIGLVLAVALTLDLADLARAERPTATPLRALGPVTAILTVPLLVGAVLTALPLLQDERLAVRRADLQAARWAEANLPQGTRIGSWDAGLIGYSTSRPVINLDGVVNDVGWLHALRDGTTAARLQREGVRWYINHSTLVEGRCASLIEALARLDPSAAERAEQVVRWDYTQRGSLNGGPYGEHLMATCVLRVPARPGASGQPT